MGWVAATLFMLGLSAMNADLDAADAAMRADATYAQCNSFNHGVQYFGSLDAAHEAWEADGGDYAMNCTELRAGEETGSGAGTPTGLEVDL